MGFSQYYNACRLANGAPPQMSRVLGSLHLSEQTSLLNAAREIKSKVKKIKTSNIIKSLNSYNTYPKVNAVVLNNDEL